jgi:hypothetical protein
MQINLFHEFPVMQKLNQKNNHMYDVTSAQEYAGYLYLGSPHADRIGKLKVGE